MFNFDVLSRDTHTRGRLGRLTTPHGVVQTPTFMPVGTAGTVQGVWPGQLAEVGVEIVLANTYHLALRPGAEVVAQLGGLHGFMGWDGPILTDSGGFQIFSLADLAKIDDDGVSFRSHIDGSPIRLTPAEAIRIQNLLGADIIMVIDQCPPYPSDKKDVADAVRRSVKWAGQCMDAHRDRDRQGLFAINQGGVYHDLRAQCMEQLVEMDFPGYAIGGLSVGEPQEMMLDVLAHLEPLMPADKPRYLMGVGTPHDMVAAVAGGVDMFDCVMPTRNGRNAWAFTCSGPIRLRNARHTLSDLPLDPECDCPVCTGFCRGYIRHLFQADRMLGPMLVSLHNIAYYERLMSRLRQAIGENRLSQYREWFFEKVAQRPNIDEENHG